MPSPSLPRVPLYPDSSIADKTTVHGPRHKRIKLAIGSNHEAGQASSVHESHDSLERALQSLVLTHQKTWSGHGYRSPAECSVWFVLLCLGRKTCVLIGAHGQ